VVANRTASVHTAQFPKVEEIFGSSNVPDDPKQLEDWTTLRSVREQVLKELEGARNAKLIGKAVEAQVKVAAAEPVYSVLARYRDQLRYVFIVSAVTLEQKSGNGTGPVTVSVSKADGQKCERCWNYSVHVGDDKNYPGICERCSAVLKELEGNP
jgi:isoleucyl-tRNA synthetase